MTCKGQPSANSYLFSIDYRWWSEGRDSTITMKHFNYNCCFSRILLLSIKNVFHILKISFRRKKLSLTHQYIKYYYLLAYNTGIYTEIGSHKGKTYSFGWKIHDHRLGKWVFPQIFTSVPELDPTQSTAQILADQFVYKYFFCSKQHHTQVENVLTQLA